MADKKRNNGEGQTAGQRLQALRAQIAALRQRKTELAALDRQPDGVDPAGWVDQVKAALGEAAAIERVLPNLEEQARAAEAQLAEVRRADTERAFAAARAGLEPRLVALIEATAALEVELGALHEQEALCRALGGWCPNTYSGYFGPALAGARGGWRREWPELLGLPRNPTPQEARIAEVRAEVTRAEEMLAWIRGRQPSFEEVDRKTANTPRELEEIIRCNAAGWRAVQDAEPVWRARLTAWQEALTRARRRLLEAEDPAQRDAETGADDVITRALRLARQANLSLEEAMAAMRRQDLEARQAEERLVYDDQ
jgi:hypothetical protein